MPRTPQKPVCITREEFEVASVRLRAVQDAISKAVEGLPPGEGLDVIYAASLERGIKSLEAVEPEIRRALNLFELRARGTNSATQPPQIPGVRRASEIAAPPEDPLPEDLKRVAKKAKVKEQVTGGGAAAKKGGRKKKSG